MIDYETFCKIRDCRERQRLTVAQTARALHLHPRTVAKWSARSHFEPRRAVSRGSVLDPFKPRVTRLLDTYPYSAHTSHANYSRSFSLENLTVPCVCLTPTACTWTGRLCCKHDDRESSIYFSISSYAHE